jgi:hypothetical protein
MAVPKPPITDHIITLPPRVDGVGLNVNGWNRQPGATVLHSMAGSLKGTDGYFHNPSCGALTDYGIGQTNHGNGYAEIIQWCDIHGRIEPWASGPVMTPEGDGPRWLAHIGGAGAVNEVGVSIEHDDTTRANGQTGTPGSVAVTAYQWAASVWLQAWLHAEVFHQTASSYDWNLWHREICGSAYKTCPNPRICDYVTQYQAAVKAVMAHCQEGKPYPAGGVVINGMVIAVPEGAATGGNEVKEPAPGTADQYLNQHGQLIAVVNFGGVSTEILGVNYADIGGSTRNKAKEEWDISLKQGVMGQWVKRPGT